MESLKKIPNFYFSHNLVFLNLLSQLNTVIFINDLKNNKFIFTNDYYYETSGFNKNEIKSALNLKDLYRKIIHTDDIEKLNNIIHFCITNKLNFYNCFLRLNNKTGDFSWYYGNINLISENNVEEAANLIIFCLIKFPLLEYSISQMDYILKEFKQSNYTPMLEKLTSREIEIIKAIAKHKSPERIAVCLKISTFTVQTHIRNIMKKLNVNKTSAIISFANESGII